MLDHSITENYDRFVALTEAEPRLRAVDAAAKLGLSEAELVEAKMTTGAARKLRRTEDFGFAPILEGMQGLGEVMCLTRNPSAVHERYGEFDNVKLGKGMGLVLNRTIDLRVMMMRWAFGFVIEEEVASGVRISVQFFDKHGVAVHKIYATEKTDRARFDKLVADWVDPAPEKLSVEAKGESEPDLPDVAIDVTSMRQEWGAMTDVHQFMGLLKRYNVGRMQALRLVGEDWAYELPTEAMTWALERAASRGVSVMFFVGSPGCIQIHTDPINNIKLMGPWINVLDEKFHMHLRQDHVAHLWVVKKPSDTGFVTSVEAFNDKGENILLMFGERGEGNEENPIWRELVASLDTPAEIPA
ncbi:MAG: ChuX/HutX family heme-like substrate-binding protein [Pseudomonadota bacterium]